jgi:hypothetical protein
MTRGIVRWIGVGFVALCAGAAGALLTVKPTIVDDPEMRTFRDLPPFIAPSWMSPEDARVMADLDEVSRRRQWSAPDTEIILVAMRLDDPGDLEESSPARTLQLPPPSAARAEVDAWLANPGASELIEWLAATHRRNTAWTVVKERLRLGLETPSDITEFAKSAWITGLRSPDQDQRLESASALIYTKSIESEAIRLQVEALRLGDSSADVRAAVDRGLQQYDRVFHGIEPDGTIAKCNTCP